MKSDLTPEAYMLQITELGYKPHVRYNSHFCSWTVTILETDIKITNEIIQEALYNALLSVKKHKQKQTETESNKIWEWVFKNPEKVYIYLFEFDTMVVINVEGEEPRIVKLTDRDSIGYTHGLFPMFDALGIKVEEG